jgi:hypothetical protein
VVGRTNYKGLIADKNVQISLLVIQERFSLSVLPQGIVGDSSNRGKKSSAY